MSDLHENERAPGTTAISALSPGARLAEERQVHGFSVEQVASQLNLAPRQIVALEADNYAALPGMVIVRGFLRAYAKLLKVDPVPLLAVLVDKNSLASAVPMRHALSGSFSESRLPSVTGTGAHSKGLPLVAGLAVVVVVGVASYALGWLPESITRKIGQLRSGTTTGGNAAPETATDLSATDASSSMTTEIGSTQAPVSAPGGMLGDAALPLQSSSAPTLQTANSAATAAEAVKPPTTRTATLAAAESLGPINPLVLNVRDDSWVEIKRADNTLVISRIIKGGSVETFEVSQPVTVTIGNIAGVRASLRGAPLDLSSAATGNVARLRLK